MKSCTTTINFLIPFKDFHLISNDIDITVDMLETWTLGRLKIPAFEDEAAMIDWIVGIDFLVRSESFVLSGPTYPYYYAWKIENGNYVPYTKRLSVEDVNGNLYQIPERYIYNKNQKPLELLDSKKLLDYLKKEDVAYLNSSSCGPFGTDEKVDGKYFFKDICMYGIVEFLFSCVKVNYIVPESQKALCEDTIDFISDEAFDEANAFWKRKDKNNNPKAFVISSKLIPAKKEEQLENFDTWMMWHEKFIHENTLYFVLFQTDEIADQNPDDYFKPLVKGIGKRYRLSSTTMDMKSYVDMKMKLRQS